MNVVGEYLKDASSVIGFSVYTFDLCPSDSLTQMIGVHAISYALYERFNPGPTLDIPFEVPGPNIIIALVVRSQHHPRLEYQSRPSMNLWSLVVYSSLIA